MLANVLETGFQSRNDGICQICQTMINTPLVISRIQFARLSPILFHYIWLPADTRHQIYIDGHISLDSFDRSFYLSSVIVGDWSGYIVHQYEPFRPEDGKVESLVFEECLPSLILIVYCLQWLSSHKFQYFPLSSTAILIRKHVTINAGSLEFFWMIISRQACCVWHAYALYYWLSLSLFCHSQN